MRCGGSWKRGYGTTYTGTKGETLDTDKVSPSELPRQLSTLPGIVNRVNIQSCDYGVMYGWGSPIGNHNKSQPALYTFSFAKTRNELGG